MIGRCRPLWRKCGQIRPGAMVEEPRPSARDRSRRPWASQLRNRLTRMFRPINRIPPSICRIGTTLIVVQVCSKRWGATQRWLRRLQPAQDCARGYSQILQGQARPSWFSHDDRMSAASRATNQWALQRVKRGWLKMPSSCSRRGPCISLITDVFHVLDLANWWAM